MRFRTRKIGIILIVFFLFLLLSYLRLLTPVEKLILFVFDPLQTKIIQGGTNLNIYLKSTAASKSELLKEVIKLQSEINDLNSELLQLKNIEQENQKLRTLLAFKKTNQHHLVAAAIISKNNLEIEKSIVINKGSADGVKENDAVIIGKGLLIGQVTKIKLHQSLVRLTIDDKSQILATLEDSPHTVAGVLAGSQGNSLILKMLPKNIAITPGQKVITNGWQENIPADLYLGDIIKLQINENEIFNSALVETLYNIEDLKTVAVITRNTTE